MYTYPLQPSEGRITARSRGKYSYPYPIRVTPEAPLEVEELQESSVRVRLPFIAPDALERFRERGFHRNRRWYLQNNYFFDIFFTLPVRTLATRGATVDHLLVMYNGLNEILPQHSKLYDWLGHALAQYNIASVLLPTPFHLNRTPQDRTKQDTLGGMLRKPTELWKPQIPFLNFYRTLEELQLLITSLRTPSNGAHLDFYSKFTAKTEVSLFGFSMGGLRALAAFLMLNDKQLSRCVMLSSGARLPDLSPPDVGGKEWEAYTSAIRDVRERQLRESGLIPRAKVEDVYYQLYGVFFEPDFSPLTDEIKKRHRKIHAIVGTADEAVWHGATARLGSRGCSIEAVGGMKHLVSSDPYFEDFFPSFVDGIARFLTTDVEHVPRTRYQVRDDLGKALCALGVTEKTLSVEELRRLADSHKDIADLLLLSKGRYDSDLTLIENMRRIWHEICPTTVSHTTGITRRRISRRKRGRRKKAGIRANKRNGRKGRQH